MRARIILYGDTHVDDRMQLAGLQPMTSNNERLVLAQGRDLMTWVGELGRREKVDLFLHLGDLYERAQPSVASETVAVQTLGEHVLIAPELIVLGNHERPSGLGMHALEPLKSLRPDRLVIGDAPMVLELWREGSTTRLVTPQLGGVVQAQDGERRMLCAIAVFPYPVRSGLAVETDSREATNAAISQALEGLLQGLTVLTEPYRAAGVPTILAGHGTLRGAAFDEYQTVPLSDVQIPTTTFSRYTCAVFGHLHLRQWAVGAGWPHHYVGSSDRQDFGEEESDHGISMLEIDEAGQPEIRFVPYPRARRFVTLDAAALVATLRPGQQELGLFMAESEGAIEPGRFLSGATVADNYVLRVKGQVDEESGRQIALLVRRWRSAGWVVAYACKVERAARARVEIAEDAPLLVRGTEAVFAARADLALHRDQILEHLARLRPNGLAVAA